MIKDEPDTTFSTKSKAETPLVKYELIHNGFKCYIQINLYQPCIYTHYLISVINPLFNEMKNIEQSKSLQYLSFAPKKSSQTRLVSRPQQFISHPPSLIVITFSELQSSKMSRARETQPRESIEKELEAGNQHQRALQSQRKKPILLRELQNELKHLDDMDEEEDFQNCEDPCLNDGTLGRLKLIAREAGKLEIREIEKLCRLAIGKRILNLQLKKKKDEHNAKLKKKEKIELFFRENRIRRFDYDTLTEEKLAASTLIVRAYENGKGFLESDRPYRAAHPRALLDCEYTATVKEVNRIFYKNYSGSPKASSSSDTLLRFVWLPLVVFVGLGLSLPFATFAYEELVLVAVLGVVVAMLGAAALLAFLEKPNANNQIEQSIEDVRSFFESLNKRLALQGRNIEWICPREFMFLEVVFHAGLPA